MVSLKSLWKHYYITKYIVAIKVLNRYHFSKLLSTFNQADIGMILLIVQMDCRFFFEFTCQDFTRTIENMTHGLIPYCSYLSDLIVFYHKT